MANIGVPATLFVTLRDPSGNVVTPDNSSQEAAATASLQLLDPEADSQALSVSLTYSADDQALIGQYTAALPGVYYLQLTSGEDSAAGIFSFACLFESHVDIHMLRSLTFQSSLSAGRLPSGRIMPQQHFRKMDL